MIGLERRNKKYHEGPMHIIISSKRKIRLLELFPLALSGNAFRVQEDYSLEWWDHACIGNAWLRERRISACDYEGVWLRVMTMVI